MDEQERAAEAMELAGWRYRDMGFGFHVRRYGVWMSPTTILKEIARLQAIGAL